MISGLVPEVVKSVVAVPGEFSQWMDAGPSLRKTDGRGARFGRVSYVISAVNKFSAFEGTERSFTADDEAAIRLIGTQVASLLALWQSRAFMIRHLWRETLVVERRKVIQESVRNLSTITEGKHFMTEVSKEGAQFMQCQSCILYILDEKDRILTSHPYIFGDDRPLDNAAAKSTDPENPDEIAAEVDSKSAQGSQRANRGFGTIRLLRKAGSIAGEGKLEV